VSVSLSFPTPKIVVSVSVPEGLGVEKQTPTPKHLFCVLKENNTNKLGFSVQKYFRHLQGLVSVLVSDFPTPK
jgi:hypothetical protein